MAAPLLAPPPLNDYVSTQEKISPAYQKYLTNLNATLNGTLLPVAFVSDVNGKVGNATTLQLQTYSTSEINSMAPPNGVMVYDHTTHTAKLRVNGVWKEINVT